MTYQTMDTSQTVSFISNTSNNKSLTAVTVKHNISFNVFDIIIRNVINLTLHVRGSLHLIHMSKGEYLEH